jgi:hypothetical protein
MAILAFGARIWLEIGQQFLLVIGIALGCLGLGVFSIWSEVARGRAVNRCAVLHKGPAMALLSPWCLF